MTLPVGLPLSDAEIVALRPSKQSVDPWLPYHFLMESEPQPNGDFDTVAVLFLTNRECPFRCLMCDLWKYTTDVTVPPGAIPAQIDFALRRLPAAKHIKLYNSGNFFDPLAIPEGDYPAIVERVSPFRTVVVENHPKFCTSRVAKFQQLLRGGNPLCQLEIAMGLETVHPTALAILNKRMNTDDFKRACDHLGQQQIALRSFVLLRPPTLTEQEGIEWAIRSVEFAFQCGVTTVSIIPTRSGNGTMEQLTDAELFEPPRIESLEEVLIASLRLNRGRVFADLWDSQRWVEASPESQATICRLAWMNRYQCTPGPDDLLRIQAT